MADVPSVSGTVIRANRKAFGTILGESVVQRVFQGDPLHAFWDRVTGLEWLELGQVERSVRALASSVGREPIGLNVEATRLGTEDSFRTIWRVLLRFTSDDALVARSATLYGRAFNTGSLAYEPITAGRADLRVVGWDDPPPLHMHGLASGIETMLKLAGRPDARVRYEVEGRQAVFRATSRGSLPSTSP